MILALAEILAGEELLGADDLSSIFRGLLDQFRLFLAIGDGVGGASHLRQADGDGTGCGRGFGCSTHLKFFNKNYHRRVAENAEKK